MDFLSQIQLLMSPEGREKLATLKAMTGAEVPTAGLYHPSLSAYGPGGLAATGAPSLSTYGPGGLESTGVPSLGSPNAMAGTGFNPANMASLAAILGGASQLAKPPVQPPAPGVHFPGVPPGLGNRPPVQVPQIPMIPRRPQATLADLIARGRYGRQ